MMKAGFRDILGLLWGWKAVPRRRSSSLVWSAAARHMVRRPPGVDSYCDRYAKETSMTSEDTLILSPLAFEPPRENPAVLNFRGEHPVLGFDDQADRSAVFSAVLPNSYGGRGLSVALHYALAEAVAGSVAWSVAFERVGAGRRNLDQEGFAAARTVVVQPVPAEAGQVDVATLAFADGPELADLAPGDAFRLKIIRANALGTAPGDAQLLFVVVQEL
jgi:hypothetical protein